MGSFRVYGTLNEIFILLLHLITHINHFNISATANSLCNTTFEEKTFLLLITCNG